MVVKFVRIPRGLKRAEAKKALLDSCECEVRNAMSFVYFVLVKSGDIESVNE